MSLDMTVGARQTALDCADEIEIQIETQSVVAIPAWLAGAMMAAATVVGVMFCSALGVLLFLR